MQRIYEDQFNISATYSKLAFGLHFDGIILTHTYALIQTLPV